ncbi:MFS transporter [Sneathiella sp.]|uniref:MFS transporter n=1 Tax=Sneathiella sp. TaxID=1964365 RepID=UPI0026385ADC|nr:MFS transporter [Sneathiella sp.]MDF2367561.1 MFS transporter [Sneathiella sp.]
MKNETATAFKIITTLSIVYVASNFYRSSIAVIAPNMMDEIGLTHGQLGVIGGAFFIAFAIFQVPVGIFLDRYGPRRTICGMMLFAVLGSAGFAVAADFLELTAARFMIGVGCAPVLMGSLVIISRWLSAERFAFYTSLVVGMGGLGNILATTPTAILTDMIGWRDVFWIASLVSALSIVFGYLIIRDAPKDHAMHSRKAESLKDALGGVIGIIKDRQFQYIFAINLVIYGTIMAIVGLWGGNYLRDIYGLDLTTRGNILFWMTIAVIGGNFFYGYLDGVFRRRKSLVAAAAVITISLLVILGSVPVIAVWQISSLLIVFSFFGSYGVVIMSHGRSIFPEERLGRGIATLNTAVFLGVFLLQSLGGFIIGAFASENGTAPLSAYRVFFFCLAAIITIALLIYSRSKESKTPKEKAPEPA